MSESTNIEINPRLSPTKHELMVVTKSTGGLIQKQWAGEAFYHPDEDYFQLQLAIFPFPYFMTRNKDSKEHYTVWAQKVHGKAQATFRRPVGRGKITSSESSQQLFNYVEIDVPLLGLRQSPMVCLFPSH